MTMNLTIRPVEDTDEADVAALWRHVFVDDPPWNVPEQDIRRKLSEHRELFLVALDGKRLIGSAMGGWDGHRGWVYSVAVHEDFRRQSVGRRLMEGVEEGLRAVGCHKLNLQVRASNQAVVDFYLRLGYQVEQRVSMGKRL